MRTVALLVGVFLRRGCDSVHKGMIVRSPSPGGAVRDTAGCGLVANWPLPRAAEITRAILVDR